MLKRAALIGLGALILTSCMVTTLPNEVEAASGSFTIYPGQMYNITFGYCEVNHLLLWYVSVSGWTPAFSDWLEKPDGTQVALSADTWGFVADQAGFWKLGFKVDTDGISGTTVDYRVEHVVPAISIASPSDGGYVTEVPFEVSGSVDDWATIVSLSLDNVSYTSVDVVSGSWTWEVPSEQEGQYTVYAEETIEWGAYSARFYDSASFTVDCTHPSFAIISPVVNLSGGTYLQGILNLSWQCSDDFGIANREVKIDAADWQEVAVDTFVANLPDGQHVAEVRVTDLAGNTASGQVTFVCDTVVPEVEITGPSMNTKFTKDKVVVRWAGSDDLSGIDHYEVRISGDEWIDVGSVTSYEFTGLDDGWYSVNVKAVDKSGNSVNSTVGFQVSTSFWSQDGPYHGIPLYALIAAIIILIVIGYAWAQHRTKLAEPPEEEEP